MVKGSWKDYLFVLLVSVILAVVIRSVFLTAYKVPTGSMQPTLKPGDFIFTFKPSYGVHLPFSQKVLFSRLPARGDLVIFSYPQQQRTNYVKRVVALPGDRVELKQGRLWINGSQLDYQVYEGREENPDVANFDLFVERDGASARVVVFAKKRGTHAENFGPIVVPPDEVFLLGDNRDASDDSRYWGTVPMSQVEGKVLFIWLSLDYRHKWGGERYPSVRWERVFSTLH